MGIIIKGNPLKVQTVVTPAPVFNRMLTQFINLKPTVTKVLS
jgi:hypothetical protein